MLSVIVILLGGYNSGGRAAVLGSILIHPYWGKISERLNTIKAQLVNQLSSDVVSHCLVLSVTPCHESCAVTYGELKLPTELPVALSFESVVVTSKPMRKRLLMIARHISFV